LHQRAIKDGLLVEHVDDGFDFEFLFPIMQFRNDANQPLLAKWNQRSAPDHGRVLANAVSENGLKRDGKTYVGKGGHQLSVFSIGQVFVLEMSLQVVPALRRRCSLAANF
jgi:hypothetical protein